MNRDFAEILSALSDAGADFVIVGAHALAAHGLPRATEDLDIWVRPSPENARRVLAALRAFGAPLHDLEEKDLVHLGTVFQIGVVPSRVDILIRHEQPCAAGRPLSSARAAMRSIAFGLNDALAGTADRCRCSPDRRPGSFE